MVSFVRRYFYAIVYLLAGVTFIAFGIWQKSLLNWIVGPVWLVAFVEISYRVARKRGLFDETETGAP